MAQQITTFIPNSPGSLAAFCRILKAHDIDMRAMNVGDATDFGIVRIIVNDTEKALRVLTEEDFVCQRQEVLAIEVDDHPGALVEILSAFGEEQVNLDYTYALFSRREGTAGFVIKTDDRAKAQEVLLKAGIRVIPDEEL